MRFPYLKVWLDQRSEFFGSAILKPIIPITVATDRASLDYAALIDSGADFCIFHAEIGEYLGITVRTGQREVFGGVQERGGAEAFLHEVTLTVGGRDCRAMIGFSYDIARHGFGILGQRGFFDNFIVKFDLLREEMELKERR